MIFLGRLIFFYRNFRLVIEWLIFRLNRFNIEFLIFLDWVRILFIRVVLIISSIIIIYRVIYIGVRKYFCRYIYLVLLFVVSILLIILRPNVVRILFGWDGLGLVSYCLVIFYQNYRSYNSGLITVLINRLGDVLILIVIGIILIYGRWNIFILKKIKLIIILLILAAITKRAQIPFSTWLPLAIAAPTPVSALVHSSTLVTAGIYLIIRFRRYLIERGINQILLYFSVLTILISGLIANFEFDLKKIIALSTLRQLGLIIIILGIGYSILSFYHLLTHAIFKSLLFIGAGVIIHLIINNQDIRFIGGLIEYIPFTIIRFQITLIALCGFPFLSGFYSKDLIIEFVYSKEINSILYLIILISLAFTIIYSLRLIYYVFINEIKFFRIIGIYENNVIGISILLLTIIRIFFGSILNWIFFLDELIFLRIGIKVITLQILILGWLGFIIFQYLNLIKLYYLRYFLRSIWFLNYFWEIVVKYIIFIRWKFYYQDKVWIEFYGNIFFLQIIFEYKKFRLNYKYKIFIFLYWFISVFFILLILKYLNSL